MKNLKPNQKCWCLYVNLTSFYTSFKIEEGNYLGILENSNFKDYHVVETVNDQVNYVNMEDIFESEQDAAKYLIKLLNKKYGKK